MNILQNFTKKIEDEILQSEEKIASIERRISRLRAKLKNPEFHLQKEQGNGTKLFKKANGEEVVHKSKNFKKDKKIDIVSETVSFAAAPVAKEEKIETKKSSWLF